jgi:putative peptidoglycan lipid II flippase
MPGLFFIALNRVLAPAFYAQSDSASPTLAGIISFGVNILLASLLVGPMKGAGLALALSLASAVNTALLLIFLRKNPHIVLGKALMAALGYTVKLVLFSGLALIPVFLLSPPLTGLFAGRGRFIAQGLPLAINAAVYGTTGLLLLFLTGDKQIRGILRMFRGKQKTGKPGR